MKPERRKRKLTLVKILGKAQKLTRVQKQSLIRTALLEAAAKVVGEVGYSAAMVSTHATSRRCARHVLQLFQFTPRPFRSVVAEHE